MADGRIKQTDEDRKFVLENFERDLNNGNIHVVFQPVVRSLTGKFCNSEALSRWDDAEHGRISPAVFIPVLEESRFIYKLDLFVLNKSAEILRYEIDNGIPCVPISVNFSRLDFELMDPFSEVENIMAKYDLPKSLLCVEITESTLLEDQTILEKAIENFRNAGYEVWLDDFGSGYSALNVLKNFPITEIKLDMLFLRNYDERSRKLIVSIVQMAKIMGFTTLAEGVETKEQADFLTSIGCEKMQGYYFAKPMSLDVAISYPEASSINVETPEEEGILNRAGAVNVMVDSPVAISVYDRRKKNYRILFANKVYRDSLASIGFESVEDMNEAFSNPERHQNERMYELAESARTNGRGSIIFFENDEYMSLKIEKLSEEGDLTLFKDELVKIDMQNSQVDLSRFDRQIRNLMELFSGIYYFNANDNNVEIIQSYIPVIAAETLIKDARDFIRSYSENYIHPDDREEFKKYMTTEYIYAAAQKSPYSEAISVFREKKSDGSYRRMVYEAIALFKTKHKDILLAVKEDVNKSI